MPNKIKVLVADDHALFRKGFSQLIESFEKFEICHESADGHDILNFLENDTPDIITLDLGMPEFPESTILSAIRKTNTKAKILIVSMHDELSLIKQTIQQGADGYITKNAGIEEVEEALNKMSKGEHYLPKAIAEQLAFYEQKKSNSNSLTPREMDILRMISIEGLSLIQIAERLDISPKTVTSHKSNIMLKIGATNNAEFIKKGQKVLA